MNARLEVYLKEILLACSYIKSFLIDMPLEDFKKNVMAQQAIVMNFILIGEAINRISEKFPEFVNNHPQIKWDSIRGLRNRAVHGYFELDTSLVFQYAKTSVPELEAQIFETGVEL